METIGILAHNAEIIQLWPTIGQLVHPPTSTAPSSQGYFLLEFSPDRTLAVVAHRRWKSMVTVIDLKSGDPRLSFEMDEAVIALNLNESSVVVVFDRQVGTWDIPSGGRSFTERLKILRGARTTVSLGSRDDGNLTRGSISPSLSRIAALGYHDSLDVFDASTGHLICTTAASNFCPLWFTPDGCEIWSGSPGRPPMNQSSEEGNSLRGWKIIEDSESGNTKLEPLGPTAHPSGGFPWKSPHGHEVTPDGWVRSSTGKLLLWLPGQWRSENEVDIIWRGQFVGLLRKELLRPVILELNE